MMATGPSEVHLRDRNLTSVTVVRKTTFGCTFEIKDAERTPAMVSSSKWTDENGNVGSREGGLR